MTSGPASPDEAPSAEAIIEMRNLVPHPEGGHYRETFRDARAANGHAASTAIYFLLQAGEASRWHRVDAVEAWHWHAGAPLELAIAEAGKAARCETLGADIARGQRPQIVIPDKAWQSARSWGRGRLRGAPSRRGLNFPASRSRARGGSLPMEVRHRLRTQNQRGLKSGGGRCLLSRVKRTSNPKASNVHY